MPVKFQTDLLILFSYQYSKKDIFYCIGDLEVVLPS